MKKTVKFSAWLLIACLLTGCAGAAGGDDSTSTDSSVKTKYASTSNAGYWGVHDPKLFQDDDGTYYVYSTGWAQGVQVRKSTDLVNWTKMNCQFEYDSEFTDWVGASESWAPTVIKQNGKYYMFHGIVRDVQNVGGKLRRTGVISLSISDSATGPFKPASVYDSNTYKQSSLVRCAWSNTNGDKYAGTYNTIGSWENGFGCIDPEFVFDVITGNLKEFTIGSRTCYAVTYGSWLNGITVIYVDKDTLKPVCTRAGTSSYDSKAYAAGDVMDAPVDSISGNFGARIGGGCGAAYEGAQVIYNSTTQLYYLFVSMGKLEYEYRVGVGRSADISGPYYDAKGQQMTFTSEDLATAYHAYGSKIIGAWQFGENKGDEYGFRAPGGQSILRDSSGKILFANHTRTNYMVHNNFALQIHQMFFNKDGWPVLNMNEYAGEGAGVTSLTTEQIAGTYNLNLTETGSEKVAVVEPNGNTTSEQYCKADSYENYSKETVLNADGTVSGAYTGSWSVESGFITLNLAGAGTFKGVVTSAVDFAKKSATEMGRTVTFTALSSTDGDVQKGQYIFANRKGSILTYEQMYQNAELKSQFTASVTSGADDFKWYVYPQYAEWSVVSDSGNGESQSVSVTGADRWWAGQTGHISEKYSVADGNTLTLYISTTASAGGTVIIEGNSALANKYLDINIHKADAVADSDICWGEAGTITKDSFTAIPTNAAVSIKVTIARSGNQYTIKVYQK